MGVRSGTGESLRDAEIRRLKLASGGQTGVDRAALDVALALGLKAGGGCPKGRRAEDGVIPDRYPLTETSERNYQAPHPAQHRGCGWNADPEPGRAGRRHGAHRSPRPPDRQALPRGGAGRRHRTGSVPGLAGGQRHRRVERRRPAREPAAGGVCSSVPLLGGVATRRAPARANVGRADPTGQFRRAPCHDPELRVVTGTIGWLALR